MSHLTGPILQIAFLTVAFVVIHQIDRSHRFKFPANLLLFAMLTGVLLYGGIVPYAITEPGAEPSVQVTSGVAKVIWWIGGALVMASFVRLFVVFERKPREARLIQDLLVAMIYVGASLSIVSYVFSVPVGTLIATSGIVAVILGLALQSTLSDVFSGIALNLGRPYTVGDWIVIDSGRQGRVIETNWRATHLLNGDNDLVVIPNSTLAKSQLVNLSSPDETHGVNLSLRICRGCTPSEIKTLFESILTGSRHAIHLPAPAVMLTDMDADSVSLDLGFRVRDASRIIPAKNEMFDLVHRHLLAAGLSLACRSAEVFAPLPAPAPMAKKPGTSDLIKIASAFARLPDETLQVLANGVRGLSFAQGAEILSQDQKSRSLMLVGTGVLLVERRSGGVVLELNRLNPGDFFGERGILLDVGEPGHITALVPSMVFEVPSELLASVTAVCPELADTIAATLASRIQAETTFANGAGQSAHHPENLAQRIRALFRASGYAPNP